MAEPKPSPSSEQPAGTPAKLSPGMATLLRAGNGHQEKLPTEPGEPARRVPKSRRLLRLSLCLADVLLLGLAARLAFKNGGSFGWLEIALCSIAVLIGAWLTCLALWLD